MRFSQIFLKMGYNTVVNVYKIVKKDSNENKTVIDAAYLGMFNRYDRVPKDVWSARVHEVRAEEKEVLAVIVEGDADECKN